MTRLPGVSWLRIAIFVVSPSRPQHFARPRFHDHCLCRIMPNIRHNPAQTTITRAAGDGAQQARPGPVANTRAEHDHQDPDAITDRNQPQSTTGVPPHWHPTHGTRTSTWHWRLTPGRPGTPRSQSGTEPLLAPNDRTNSHSTSSVITTGELGVGPVAHKQHTRWAQRSNMRLRRGG
jgi:hypothetical protein